MASPEWEKTVKSRILVTTAFEKCLISAFKLGNFMQGHPYTWTDGDLTPKVVESRKSFNLWRLNTLLLFWRVGYVAWKFMYISIEGATLTLKIHVGFVLAFWLSGAALQLTYVYCRDELATFTQQFLAYFKRFENSYGHERREGRPLLIKWYPFIGKQLVKSWYMNITTLAAAVAVMPASPEFLTSIADDPEGLPYWIIGLLVLLELYILMVVVFGAAPIMFSLLGFHFLLKSCLPELVEGEARITTPKLRAPQVALRELQALRLLINLDNRVYRIFLPAIQMTIGTMLVLCIYGSIRLDGMTAVVLSVVGINLSTVLILVFGVMASVHTQTTALCEHFKNNYWSRSITHSASCRTSQVEPLHKTQLPNLRPMAIWIGSLFYIDKMQVVSMLQIIFSYAISLLLMDP